MEVIFEVVRRLAAVLADRCIEAVVQQETFAMNWETKYRSFDQ